jgi:hypothetical protein
MKAFQSFDFSMPDSLMKAFKSFDFSMPDEGFSIF